jgi:flagellar hook protein FlgE
VLQDIVIPMGGASIVRATTEANLIGNLNSDAPDGTIHTVSVTVYDSLGTARQIELTFDNTDAVPAVDNTWAWSASFDGTAIAGAAGILNFDDSGALDADVLTNSPSLTITSDLLTGASTDVPEDLTFTLSLSDVTQLAMGTEVVNGNTVAISGDVTLSNQDGFPRGTLEAFNIGGNGELNGVFSNGLTRVVAQVALGTFSNLGGLMRAGSNLFSETPASGAAQIGRPSTGGRGIVSGGVLENSNVDLGTEFANLIVTQRGFQANARTITAADTLLQETVNLVR